MTAQLLETSIPVVVALNMWDELEASSSELDTEQDVYKRQDIVVPEYREGLVVRLSLSTTFKRLSK